MQNLKKVFPTWNDTSLLFLDAIANKPGITFAELMEVNGDKDKTSSQLRGNLVNLFREELIFSDREGRGTAYYYLSVKAEEIFEEHNIPYEVEYD